MELVAAQQVASNRLKNRKNSEVFGRTPKSSILYPVLHEMTAWQPAVS